MTNLSENSTQISNWENDKVNTSDVEQSVAEKEAFKNRQHGGYQRQSQGIQKCFSKSLKHSYLDIGGTIDKSNH